MLLLSLVSPTFRKDQANEEELATYINATSLALDATHKIYCVIEYDGFQCLQVKVPFLV